MSHIFNIQRFAKLFKKHTLENIKSNLMALAVLLGLLVIAFGLILYNNHGIFSARVQSVLFGLFLIFPGIIFTSLIFADLGDPKKAIPVLTLPVSHFERFLVGWLYSFVLFQIVYVCCFYAVDVLMVQVGNNFQGATNEVVSLFSSETKPYMAFPIYAILHAFTFLGAVYFKRLHLIQTSCAVFVFGLIITLINGPLITLMFDREMAYIPPFVGASVRTGTNTIFIEPDASGVMIAYSMIVAMTVLLWTATYFKLKEKQI